MTYKLAKAANLNIRGPVYRIIIVIRVTKPISNAPYQKLL